MNTLEVEFREAMNGAGIRTSARIVADGKIESLVFVGANINVVRRRITNIMKAIGDPAS